MSTNKARQPKQPGEPHAAAPAVKRKLENGSAKSLANGSVKKAKVPVSRLSLEHGGMTEHNRDLITLPGILAVEFSVSLQVTNGTAKSTAKRQRVEESSDDEDSGGARTTTRQRKRQVPVFWRSRAHICTTIGRHSIGLTQLCQASCQTRMAFTSWFPVKHVLDYMCRRQSRRDSPASRRTRRSSGQHWSTRV